MSIVDFDCLKVTTMTVIVKLKGNVIIENIFPLLNITRLDLPPTSRQTKKFKIPYCGIPGAILSAKFRNITRGIVKSNSKRSFLNSITIDICTSKKNINAKLSGEIIHMCGPDSEELAIETANHIIDHLLKLQEELNYIHQTDDTFNDESDNRSDESPNTNERLDRTLNWIKENTIGKDYIVDAETQEIIELSEGDKISCINKMTLPSKTNQQSSLSESRKVIIDKNGNIKTRKHESLFTGNSWIKQVQIDFKEFEKHKLPTVNFKRILRVLE